MEEPEVGPVEKRGQRRVVEVEEEGPPAEGQLEPDRRVAEREDGDRATGEGQTDEEDEVQVLGTCSGGIRLPRRPLLHGTAWGRS